MISEQTSLNILLDIGISELLLNLVSFHVLTEKTYSTVILNCRSSLVNNYLAKGLFNIEEDSKQSSMIPNEVKLRIHAIEQLYKYFFMTKNKAVSSVANTIKKFYIQYDLHFIYKQMFIKINNM